MDNTDFTVFIFSTHDVSGVRNFNFVCSVWFFVLCLWSDQSEFMALFMVLIFDLFQALFFFSLMVFLIFLYFPVTTPGLDLFSGAYLKFSVSTVPSD